MCQPLFQAVSKSHTYIYLVHANFVFCPVFLTVFPKKYYDSSSNISGSKFQDGKGSQSHVILVSAYDVYSHFFIPGFNPSLIKILHSMRIHEFSKMLLHACCVPTSFLGEHSRKKKDWGRQQIRNFSER